MSGRLTRRRWLGQGAGVLGQALVGISSAQARPLVEPEHLVFLRLRGGADGLSLLVPYTDAAYYRARLSTALDAPARGPGSALPLGGAEFALHPELGPLRQAFFSGELGALVGVGMPELVRSHANAERALRAAIRGAVGAEPTEPVPGSLAAQLDAVQSRLREREAPRAFSVEMLGWDTHTAQGNGRSGRLAESVAELARELERFRRELGAELPRVLVVVLTEFGRSLSETPLLGTDDGHASVLLLLGGPSPWGRVLGRAPSLEREQLSKGRYLRPTCDLREVLVRLARGQELA